MEKHLDPTDAKLGAAIRRRRKAAGLTLEGLGAATGVTYQQVQKYETGANRVSFSTLLKIGSALGCGAGPLLEEVAGDDGISGQTPEVLRLAAMLEQLPAVYRHLLVETFVGAVTAFQALPLNELPELSTLDRSRPVGRA